MTTRTFAQLQQTAISRAVWFIVAIASLIVFVMAVPQRYQMLLADTYGFGAPLTELGLSLRFFAIYFTFFELLLAGGSWLVGVIIAWRKGDDWFALLTACTLILIGFMPPLLNGLIYANPAWSWLMIILRSLGFTGLFAVFCLFPNGRFTPRWLRFILMGWLVLMVIGLLSAPEVLADTAIMPNTVTRSDAFWLVFQVAWFVPVLIGQWYRYRRVSTAVEQQQTKWVVWGFTIPVLISLFNAILLLAIPALRTDPIANTVLTLTLGVLLLVSTLLIPLALALAIFRYRLWQIDIILNRTLVYGGLTAGVTAVYVLLVGGIGTLAANQQSNSGVMVVTTMIVMVGIRPLHGWLQSHVNKLLPVPSPSTPLTAISQPIQMRSLYIIWAINMVLMVILFVAGVIAQNRSGYLQNPTELTAVTEVALGQLFADILALDARLALWMLAASYAQAAVFVSMGLFLFWRKSADVMGVWASWMMAAVGVGFSPPVVSLPQLEPLWHIPTTIFQIGLFGSIFLFLCMFPDGRFYPKWTRYTAVIWLIVMLAWLPFPQLNPHRTSQIWPIMVWVMVVWVGIIAQIIRYRRLSATEEKQQTKWVIAGFALANCGLLATAILIGLEFTAATLLQVAILAGLGLASMFIPLTISIALFRYRLWQIDIIINRTLVYGGLTAVITLLYVGFVGVAGTLLVGRQGQIVGAVLATGVVVGAARPLYRQIQTLINRILPAQARPSLPKTTPLTAEPNEGMKLETEPALDAIPVSWRLPIRLFLVVFALSAVVLLLGAIPTRLAQLEAVCVEAVCPALILVPSDFEVLQRWGVSASAYAIFQTIIELILVVPVAILWGLVFRRYTQRWVGVLACLGFVFLGVSLGNVVWSWTQTSELVAFIGDIISEIGATALLLLLFLFPDGRFVTRWSRYSAYVLLFIILPFGLINLIISPGHDQNIADTINGLSFLLFIVLGTIAQIVRYRRYSNRLQQQQTKWVVMGVVSLMLGVLQWFLFMELFPFDPGLPRLTWNIVGGVLGFILSAFFPVSLGLAILNYRLWDIDLLINRTLVYVGMSIIIVGFYTFIVSGLSAVFRAQANFLTTLLATGLIAVLFQPMRERMQRGVNRMIFGDRDDPTAVLARLGQRLEAISQPDAVLPAIVETVAQALKLPYVAITLPDDVLMAETGIHFDAPLQAFSLTYQSETIGQLRVAARSPNEALSEADERVLRQVAVQAGTAVHAIRLTHDLQQSRIRLVTTREEERRRLRRDLHDELGPLIASQGLKLAAARELLRDNPELAAQLLDDVLAKNQNTVADVRRLVYNLRPPSLDELGLVGAIREHVQNVEQTALQVTITAPDELPPLSAAVEAAAYRIVLEAYTNVVRHAGAGRCEILLRLETRNWRLKNAQSPISNLQSLILKIEDDGVGLNENGRHGIGLISMRERAEEVGGVCEIVSSERGVRVTAVLPLGM